MWNRILVGAIPTFVAGIALMTLAAPQKSGVALNQVKMTAAKAPSHSGSHTSRHNPNKAAHSNPANGKPNATSTDHDFQYGYGWSRGYHGYRGYSSYRGYRGYYGYRGYHGYYSYYSYEGNDDVPEEE